MFLFFKSGSKIIFCIILLMNTMNRKILWLIICFSLSNPAFAIGSNGWYTCPSIEIVQKPYKLTQRKFCNDVKKRPDLINQGESCKEVYQKKYAIIRQEYKQGKCEKIYIPL